MEDRKSILHELYVFSEWKPEPEYLQKPDTILPEDLSGLWRWLKFFGPKKSLINSISAYKERQQKWHIALGDEGKVIAILTDQILEIRTKRSEYATIAARTTVSRDAYAQWRRVVWSPDCSFVAVAYGNGVVSFFDLTASNLFNIPTDCTRPGGLECSDNTHAVADIIFLPLKVKDNKWNWEVLVVTFDGKLRGFLVSQTDGFKLHHKFTFAGGVGAVTYSTAHSLLYVAGVPYVTVKSKSVALRAGLTAWRPLTDEPFYKLSVVSDELEMQGGNDRLRLFIPFRGSNKMSFILNMVISPDGSKLVCLHCTGEISLWTLPVLSLLQRWPLPQQPDLDLNDPLLKNDAVVHYPVDINWWSNEELIVSRGSGLVSVCDTTSLHNLLSSACVLRGPVRLARAPPSAALALECEMAPRPPRSTDVVSADADTEDTMFELTKEMFKSILYAITDMETFQPRPRRITVVSRVYRLLMVKSTTPEDLFSRKIESGHYSDALALAETFHLDSDLVYQQQWRKTPVSTDAIQKYLSKVSKKIWAVHQCVDRLPETLPAAKELLQFGLTLTNEEILTEINKERDEDALTDTDSITLEDLNAYTSELLRCRHVMLFYKQRLKLYEAILHSEKSTYIKDEYDRLRSNSIVHSAIELAKEGRIDALTCLWSHMKATSMKMAVLDKLPETVNPLDYRHLLDSLVEENKNSLDETDDSEQDWCRKEIFRSIWNSNWSEDSTPEAEEASELTVGPEDITNWYEKRAREIENRSGLVSHAITLVTIGREYQRVVGLNHLMFHLLTLDTLVYDLNIEDVTLDKVEKSSTLEICQHLMKKTTLKTIVSDIKEYLIPCMKRCERLTNQSDLCINGLIGFLESSSIDDLSKILKVLQSTVEFELDVRTRLDLVERCLLAHVGTHQLSMVCDLLDTVNEESDGSISPSELTRRKRELRQLVDAATVTWGRGAHLPLAQLRDLREEPLRVRRALATVARSLACRDDKPTQQDWENLLKDIINLQSTVFTCVTKEECYEIYASSLLTSGDAPSIKLACDVLTCTAEDARRGNNHLVPYQKSIELVSNAAKEYFNSASSLKDPALDLAKCCLLLIKDENPQIQEELDLIAALSVLSAFDLAYLPIQVRLCEDRMTLLEDCLKAEPHAYTMAHKLLELARLLRIEGDDEAKREGAVLQLTGWAAARSVGAGSTAVQTCARLAALRYPPAAPLLAHVAAHAQIHADRDTRRDLLASAATFCSPDTIEDILRSRLSLELEGLQQVGAAVLEHRRLLTTEDEFADAITTPVIEQKDLVEPAKDNKMPLFNYILETWQNTFSVSADKPATEEPEERGIYCQEFYRTLYPEYKVSKHQYQYDRFSVPGVGVDINSMGQSVMKWYFVQNTLDSAAIEGRKELESEVVSFCAMEAVRRDCALGTACLLAARGAVKRVLAAPPPAPSAALLATLIACNAPELRDSVYLAPPLKMARSTLKQQNASTEQLELIHACLDKLMTMVEIKRIKEFGASVNGLLFTADEDYRKEVIFRMASCGDQEQVQFAHTLARKYGLSPLELWLWQARAALRQPGAAVPAPPAGLEATEAAQRLAAEVWEDLSGTNHNVLINYFTLLKSVDDKTVVSGLTPSEHIKLLKKAKAASQELDYKLLVSQPNAKELSAHLVSIMSPTSAGMITKLLRALPPALTSSLSVPRLYADWLQHYFFSMVPSSGNSKKWMQQYRQCASFFTKLGAAELLQFHCTVCFSHDAVRRVPSGTRNLMLMQAVDYCQQEQENDLKINKSESNWTQAGQELTRWARFLENFHSSTVQGIINNHLPTNDTWFDVEESHGDVEKLTAALAQVLLQGSLQPEPLVSLLQALHVEVDVEEVLRRAAVRAPVVTLRELQRFVSGLTKEKPMGKAGQDSNMVSVRDVDTTHGHDSVDLNEVIERAINLLKAEWSDQDLLESLNAEKLRNEEYRRKTFMLFMERADSWQQKKALVEVLNCTPVCRVEHSKSLHCEFLRILLNTDDRFRSLNLIRMLLSKPLLIGEEIEWLLEDPKENNFFNLIWIIVWNKCGYWVKKIPSLFIKHKEIIQKTEIECELIRELLANGLLPALVPTPIYPDVVNYVLHKHEIAGQPVQYNVPWAARELRRHNMMAEAGHLEMLDLGIPKALRTYTQSIFLYKSV